jgi:hypothetical protein
MTAAAARYANWKAPAQDGQLLIWPQPDDLLRQTRENARSLSASDSVRLGGIALPVLRRNLRVWLGHTDDTAPLVATGHQTELYHPGVWVKDILTNAVADRVGGMAFHFAVDTDQPKHLAVRWPGQALPITDDPAINSAAWSGQLASPTPAHLRSIDQAMQASSSDWNFKPMLGNVLDSLRRSAMEESGLSAAVTNAQHELDWNLGLRHRAMLASPLLSSREYLIFVHHLLSRAGQFAADYNAALADYRVETGITSNTRPMPDLKKNADEIEAPFWLDDLASGTRTRAAVHRRASAWCLTFNGDAFVLHPDAPGETTADALAAWLARHQLRLSPRALTLTTFLRLLVVDQFVHGIGGGRYDQVTDRVLATHFGIEPPRFAVTTATLFFPGAVGQPRVCMPCLAQEGHRLKHRLLGDAKQDVLDSIKSMPRRSIQRSLAFHNMHSALSAAAMDHPLLHEWTSRNEIARQQEKRESVLFDRELFYAMQSRDRLERMIADFAARFGERV